MTNANLHRAKRVKNDEFYTQISDIEKEVSNYKEYFTDKTVLCNCDDEHSAFYQYFYKNFNELKLKKLIITNYKYSLEYDGCTTKKTNLSNGDFRSNECIDILCKSDIVVTNPPFSLFREFIELLTMYKKDFLVIGSLNALKYSDIFPLIMTNKLWLGYNSIGQFKQPDGSVKKFGNIVWYTNLPRGYKRLQLSKTFNIEDYPKYDNYNAIEVSRVINIPIDYKGIMGVPISYMSKHNPEQFNIVGIFSHGTDNEYDLAKPILYGKELFARIAIKSRK